MGGALPSRAGGDTSTGGTPSDGCPINNICATVSVPPMFDGEVNRIAVALYDEPPVMGATAPKAAVAFYPALTDFVLASGVDYALRQDFTVPLEGDYSGEHYVAIVLFLSTEERDAVPGVDYWYVTPEPYAIGIGDSFDLGAVSVEQLATGDDPYTGGHENAGVVFCMDRLHENAGPTEFACDVGQSGGCCLLPGQEGLCGFETCDDGVVHDCDGPEDCAMDEVCCGEPWGPHQCVTPDACAAREACHVPSDCEESEDLCVIASEGMANVAYCSGPEPSTPGDDRPGKIECAAFACDHLCCINAISPPYECGGIESCPSYEVQATFECDGPEDCPGDEDYCCLHITGGQYCSVECTLESVCHVDEDCPGSMTCSPGGTCV